MGVSSFIVPVLGLLMGIALTFQINRIFRSTAFSGTNVRGVHATSVSSTSNSSIEQRDRSRLNLLHSEKLKLNAQLKVVESEISKLSLLMTSVQPNPTGADVPPVAAAVDREACHYPFKVYVYDLPSSLDAVRIGEEARINKSLHICHKCILEQFSLEYIMQDFFTHFCGRTFNPDEADFFYLPLIRDAEFRLAQSIKTRNRAPSSAEWALLNLLEKNDSSLWQSVFNITDKYWHVHSGADHIIAMPAPVTNLRHETSQRGFFHYMMHLHTPIFLCLEYSANFVAEYPVCSTHKNIVVPYPTTDPELFSGKLTGAKVERNFLLYYAGGMHGDCVEVRKAMKFLMNNSTRLPGVIPPVRSNMAEREHGFLAATFCPIPIGDSPSSKRMYDVLNFGCVPVVLSDDLVWAYSDQTNGPLDHRSFSVQMPQSVVHFTAHKSLARFAGNKVDMGTLPSGTLLYDLLDAACKAGKEYQNGIYVNPLVLILQNIPPKDVEFLRAGVKKAAPFYRYYNLQSGMTEIPTAIHSLPQGGAIETLAAQLAQRKAKGIDSIRDACVTEKKKEHRYISRYACDGKDKVESLVRKRRLLIDSSKYVSLL